MIKVVPNVCETVTWLRRLVERQASHVQKISSDINYAVAQVKKKYKKERKVNPKWYSSPEY